MQPYTLNEDVKVICQTVDSFPFGIKEAFDALIASFGMAGREFYGISYMDEECQIIYKVAVSAFNDDEELKPGYEPFTIRKGNYLSETLKNWMAKTDKIKDIFGVLMEDPSYDNSSPCVEWYRNDGEMLCMVKSKSVK
jgi:predicted transcriptional regulator YdeE